MDYHLTFVLATNPEIQHKLMEEMKIFFDAMFHGAAD